MDIKWFIIRVGRRIIILIIKIINMGVNAFYVLERLQQILDRVMPVLIGIAVIWFIWGVISYVISGDEEKKKDARGHIIQGLIGLFIILSFWGIVGLINNTFGVGPTQLRARDIPCVPGPGVIRC